MESQNGGVHLHRAQRHSHYRSAEDGEEDRDDGDHDQQVDEAVAHPSRVHNNGVTVSGEECG